MVLWKLEPTERFSSRAEAYRKHRPGYPESAIDHLLDGGAGEVADIGAGTGISSLPFIERGLVVYAVEPNAAMRAAGLSHPHLLWVEGTAEATGLAEASVDLVTCFQSFHWFEPSCMAELVRILRPGGAIAAVWNERDERDDFTRAYGDLVRAISKNHPAEQRTKAVTHLRHPRLDPPEHRVFENSQTLDRSGLFGRAASTSYLPASGPDHEALLAALERLHATWQADGRVTLRYRTHLYRCRLRPDQRTTRSTSGSSP